MAAARSSRRRIRRSFPVIPASAGTAVSSSGRAAYDRLEIIVRLDDFDQAILGGAVAAIGIGMVLLHQRLVFRLDGLERRVGTEPHHLQRLAFGVEYFSGFDLGLGTGTRTRPPATAAIKLAEHV